MSINKLDYTNTFYGLSNDDNELNKSDNIDINDFLQKLVTRNKNTHTESIAIMKKANPVIIPRNHNVDIALKMAKNGNMTLVNELIKALEKPYNLSDDKIRYVVPPREDEVIKQSFCGT